MEVPLFLPHTSNPLRTHTASIKGLGYKRKQKKEREEFVLCSLVLSFVSSFGVLSMLGADVRIKKSLTMFFVHTAKETSLLPDTSPSSSSRTKKHKHHPPPPAPKEVPKSGLTFWLPCRSRQKSEGQFGPCDKFEDTSFEGHQNKPLL